MCAVFQENIGWRWAFYVQSILLLPCIISIAMTPSRYMDIQGVAKELQRLREIKIVNDKSLQKSF
jgi:hypothetical protein